MESVHRVAACVADVEGRVIRAYGDIDAPVFLRSAAKPFIAASVVASGAAERFGFDARELAVMAASHDGEPFHVAAVASMLGKIGLDVTALRCGAHAPSSDAAARDLARSGVAPSALHNNCSGKHAGILAACVHLGYDPATYLDADHPVERRILETCARAVGRDVAALPLGIDGCGIPVFATSLRQAARAFARFATARASEGNDAAAYAVVRSAMAAHPAFVGGTARFDTALGVATGGRIVGKAGAEGVHGDALVREGWGLALKVLDGARRAVAPATIALLEETGALEPAERAGLDAFARSSITNVAGRRVGAVYAASAREYSPSLTQL